MTNMATCDNVLERCEDIIKSKNDTRLYRGLVLTNKMKVLLISDPMIDKSAASMNVNIGSMCDPDDLPGLAHLCERMLLLGTEKYPSANNYKIYLSENNGKSTATTYFDHTTYSFKVKPTRLMGALDRLCQFFVAPLFRDTLIKRKIKSVHSEYLQNMECDIWRLGEVDKSSANPKHPYFKFITGNKETLDVLPKQLGIDIRQNLIEFYEKYYSANVMSLCVLGAETLDKLEEMVVSLFGQVRNKEIDIPSCSEPPFDDEHFRTKWYIVPLEDVKNLRVVFPISHLQEHYQATLIYYVMNLMKRKGEGSLSSALKRRGWLNSFFRVEHICIRHFEFLIIQVDLTNKGIKHIDEIITLIFQFINMLKQQVLDERIYNEYREMAKVNFFSTHEQELLLYVSSRAFELWNHPMKKVLCGDVLFPPWTPESIDLINTIMKSLTPRNIRVHVVAQEYKDVAVETERWYGTKYKKEKIPTDIIDMWENAGLNSEFHLLERNEFIPSKFDLKPLDDDIKEFPTIIADTPFVRMWFKQDDEYFVPKAKMFFEFLTPYVQIDAVNFTLTNIYSDILQNSFADYEDFMNLVGLHFTVQCTIHGLLISIHGYDDKQLFFLEKMVDRMLNIKIDPERFDIVKENYIRQLKNFETKRSHQPVIQYLDYFLVERNWTRSELLHAAAYLTADQVQAFIPQLLSKLHVECLIHGNMIKKEALDIAAMIESKLKMAMSHIVALEQQQLMVHREIKLNDGCHFLFQTENKFYKDSCTGVYYQTDMQSVESNVMLDLLTCIIDEARLDITILRAQEEFGSVVFCGIHFQSMMQGLIIVVRSDKDPRYVEKRIDLFIHLMLNHISNMSKDIFEQYKKYLLLYFLKQPKLLFKRTDIFWKEITKQTYIFDRSYIEAGYAKTITQDQLLKFFKKYIHGPNRCKLSLHLHSPLKYYDESEEEEKELDDMLPTGQIIEINDITSFKCSQLLCPIVQSCVQFPKKSILSSNL